MITKANLKEFYSGKGIFITGATGYVGKILLEKILYEFPQIKKVFIVIRPKQDKSFAQRFQEIFASPCFDRLKTKYTENFMDYIL